jgi:hypothetical protein
MFIEPIHLSKTIDLCCSAAAYTRRDIAITRLVERNRTGRTLRLNDDARIGLLHRELLPVGSAWYIRADRHQICRSPVNPNRCMRRNKQGAPPSVKVVDTPCEVRLIVEVRNADRIRL